MENALSAEATDSIFRAMPALVNFPASRYQVDYDREADILYLSFGRIQEATDTATTEDGLVLQYRGQQLVGIAVPDASSRGVVSENRQSESIEHIHEKNISQVLLNQATLRASEIMDTFSNWLLGGFGAVLAFIIANLGEAPISAGSVRTIVLCFVVSVVTAVGAKFGGAIARSGAVAGLEAFRLAASWPNADLLDSSVILKEIEHSVLWPFRGWVRKSFENALAGDLVKGARSMYKLVQWQSYLVFGQTLSVLMALIVLLWGLPG